jgi:hypothetical protein
MVRLASSFFKLLLGPARNRRAHLRSIAPTPSSFTVSDHLGDFSDPHPSAARMLAGIAWQPQTFTVDLSHDAPPSLLTRHDPDATLRFPSPAPRNESDAPDVDRVALDLYAARDRRTGQVTPAPAMLVLDILQGNNVVANFIARSLARRGIHAAVMHMPFTGKRRRPGQTDYDWREFLPSLHQAVTDARRARDVLAALPFVTGPVGIQGTSLGGFVSTIAAALDDAFDPVVITLAGADVYRVLRHGKIDAAKVHRRLCDAGHDDLTLRRSLWKTEPLRIAHRLSPHKTHLLTANRDQVVPAYHSDLLAQAAGIPANHHKHFPGCHYTVALCAPLILRAIERPVWNAQRGRTSVPLPTREPTISPIPDWASDLEPSLS